MSDGYIRCYESRWSPARAAERVDGLAIFGITLRNPESGEVTLLSAIPGEEGSQVVIGCLEAIETIGRIERQGVAIQFWFRRDYDLVASFERNCAHGMVADFALDGVAVEDRRTLLRSIVSDLGSTSLLVVDFAGGSDYQAWDSVSLGIPPGEPPAMPDLIVVDDAILSIWPWRERPDRRIGDRNALDRKRVLDSLGV